LGATSEEGSGAVSVGKVLTALSSATGSFQGILPQRTGLVERSSNHSERLAAAEKFVK
jgi:hypothetical protein